MRDVLLYDQSKEAILLYVVSLVCLVATWMCKYAEAVANSTVWFLSDKHSVISAPGVYLVQSGVSLKCQTFFLNQTHKRHGLIQHLLALLMEGVSP